MPVPPRKQQKRSQVDTFSLPSPCSSPFVPSVPSVVTESNASTSTVGEPVPNLPRSSPSGEDPQITANAAMMARIKMLEQENASFKCSLEMAWTKPFRLNITHDD